MRCFGRHNPGILFIRFGNVRKMTGIAALCLLILSAACTRRPKDILSEREMIDLLVDMTIAESMGNGSGVHELPDSIRYHLREIVLKQHGITQEQLDSTLAWYGRNLDDYVALYAEVDKRLQKRIKKESGDAPVEMTADNLWPLSPHYWFSPMSDDGTLVFTMPAEGLSKGESLEWTMKFNSTPNIDLLLGVDYDNGVSTYLKRSFRGDRRLMVTLLTDTTHTPQRIYGMIHVERGGLPAWVDSIKLVKLPFDSTATLPWSQKYLYPAARKVVNNDNSEEGEGNADDNESQNTNQNNAGISSFTEQSVSKKTEPIKTPSMNSPVGNAPGRISRTN